MIFTPTMEQDLFNGLVTVKGFGVTRISGDGCEYNWSLAHWKFKDKFITTMEAIAEHASKMHVFAPYPMKFNALVSQTKNFNENRSLDGTTLWRGPEADGVCLHLPGTGFAVSSADCATLIVMYKDAGGKTMVIASHAGRNSLIDMKRFTDGHNSRANESVVHSILEKIPKKNRGDAQVWIGLAVKPGEHFAHPRNSRRFTHNSHMIDYIMRQYGPQCFVENNGSYDDGWLDIKGLIRAQLVRGSIRGDNIKLDDTCTYRDKRDGQYLWYSQVRTPGMRNLVLVTRNNREN